MIDVALAEKFVKRSANYTQYNINVMDEKGIIIASSSPERVGSFHEVAYQIIQADKDVVEVVSADHFQGGRTGINMALFLQRQKIGVLGITGDPEEIREIARLLRMSLETMLEYEAQKKKFYQQQSPFTRFIDALLYQDEADEEGELTAVSRQMGYNPSVKRVPILIVTDHPEDSETILEKIRRQALTGTQDICAVTRSNDIIIFQALTDVAFGDYKYSVNALLDPLAALLAGMEISGRFYVGTLQDKYRYYQNSFKHCRWLKRHVDDGKQPVLFFYDHIGDYMRSIASGFELNRIFETICAEMSDSQKDSAVDLVDALSRNNYNLNDSSRELFIHKNTLIFRFNKIKDLFNVNPIQNTADREFLNWLTQYFKKNR